MSHSLSPFSGEQIVQVTNPDPFAKPVLRSPVMHTPLWMIATAQLFRLLWRLLRFLIRHPVATLVATVLAVTWRLAGWPALVALAGAKPSGDPGGCKPSASGSSTWPRDTSSPTGPSGMARRGLSHRWPKSEPA